MVLSGISVVICCFNSATRISETLRHLALQQDMSAAEWEVILIDNGSNDNTANIATNIWQGFKQDKPKFKIVEEFIPGLSTARKKGFESASYEFVVFCDDDNWLHPSYLKNALKILRKNSRIGALGGIGSPVFEHVEPPFFWKNQFHALAVGPQSATEGDITETRRVLYGAGMIVNKEAFQRLQSEYQFEFLVGGRSQGNLISSEDHELCLALQRSGYRIYYSEDLQFQHFIPKYRTSIQYYKKLFYGFGLSMALLQPYYLNDKSVHSVKNDYRYICVRCAKEISFAHIRLLLRGYIFTGNKYKFLDILQTLHSNRGMLHMSLKLKNQLKLKFKTNPIFKQKNLTLA